MSAQASGSAGGDDKKLDKASRCEKCGNRHEGACWPKCCTCGKFHKGACRFSNPVPNIVPGNAGRQPSQVGLTAGFNAQQVGYQQPYNAIRSPGMEPGMVPGVGGQIFGPVSGFGGPYSGEYGGYGGLSSPGWGYQSWGNQGWGNQGWSNQIPGHFGQGYGNFPTPSMGPGTVGSFGNVSLPTSSYGGHKQGTAKWHEMQKQIRGPRDNRKPRSKEHSKDKKEEKGPLAVKDASIEKPISKSARQRANKRASQKKKEEEMKKEEEEPAQDPLTGPADLELVSLWDESRFENAGNVENAETVEAAPLTDERMESVAPSPEDIVIEVGNIDAQSLIDEVFETPSGFQFPQDQTRVGIMAGLLEQFGQERMLDLSESAAMNGTTIVWEAFQQDLFKEQIAVVVAGMPLSNSGINKSS